MISSKSIAHHCKDKDLCGSIRSEWISCDVSNSCGDPCRDGNGNTEMCPVIGVGSVKCSLSTYGRTCERLPEFEGVGAGAAVIFTSAVRTTAAGMVLLTSALLWPGRPSVG
jgi:hypothetical protein